jgi:hypothetical protein
MDITAGLQHKPTDDLTIKSKINNSGEWSNALKVKLSKEANFYTSSSMNVKSALKTTGVPAEFGVGFRLRF